MEGLGKLEPDYEPAYNAWKTKTTPQTTGELLRTISPVIDKGVGVYASGSAGPNTKSHARRLALQAVRSYDPTKAQLGTHVMNHLKGLRRVVRRQQNVIRVPERIASDQAMLHSASLDLEDALGREPTTGELADRVGLSERRIARIRQFRPEVSEGHLLGSSETPENTMASRPYDNTELVARALFDDLNPRDQLILELSLGLNGKKVLDNQSIAGKLGITPGAVSQRKLLLQNKMTELSSMGLF